MGKLVIHAEKVTPEIARELMHICPFGALEFDGKELSVNAACRLCRLCVNKGPQGVMTFQEEASAPSIDKAAWYGITVFADASEGSLHPVSFELIGKARELAKVPVLGRTQPVQVLLILDSTHLSDKTSREALIASLLSRGADEIYVYDHPMFRHFSNTTYARAFEDYIEKVRPSSILVGATNTGRSLAPRVAAHFRTGLTADCTSLEMKENSDLVQIRPAFGGNIMAQILTENTRPQFATVRYKVFADPGPVLSPSEAELTGKVKIMPSDPAWEDKRIQITSVEDLPKVQDISEAERIVAVGRGLKKPEDLALFQAFADRIGAHLASSRPLVENGTLPPTCQIGLSGKTVKPKLIFTFGISGAVQFAAGMKSSDCIIAVNTDKNAPIFDIAHYCVVADMYDVVRALTQSWE